MMGKLPKDWEIAKFEDCMAAIIDYRGKTPRKTTSGIPLITAKIVKNGRIDTPNEFIDPGEYEEWMRRGLPKKGDILVTRMTNPDFVVAMEKSAAIITDEGGITSHAAIV